MTANPARRRFLMLAAVRIVGVLAIMFGIVIASGRRPDVPLGVGYALVVAGFLTIAVLTRRMARAWRTPPDDIRP